MNRDAAPARRGLDEARTDAAYRMFYGEGLGLGAVAAALGCGIYALTPWLLAPARRIADAATADADARIRQLAEALRAAGVEIPDPPGAG